MTGMLPWARWIAKPVCDYMTWGLSEPHTVYPPCTDGLYANETVGRDMLSEQCTLQEPDSTLPEDGAYVEGTSNQEPKASESRSHMFALLIGINDYKSKGMHKLQGAVADAYAIKEYLHDMLETDDAHIQMLENMDATKDGIVAAIQDLSTNAKIQKDDAILIYFSGHGGFCPPPDQWKDFCQQTELIMPYDADITTGGNLIADRQLAYHLRGLATAKGNNITVILDCCHSGSGTRAYEENDGSIIRGVQASVPILLDPGHEISTRDLPRPQFLEREGSMADGFPAYSEASHVLLAACRQDEKAREKAGRGLFTKALLETLRSYTDIHDVTYKDLIANIAPLKSQHPQCEGQHKSRIVFGGKTPRVMKYLHNVEYNDDSKYIMKAGKAHGIGFRAQYRIFRDQKSIVANDPIGVMEALDVQDTITILKPLVFYSRITEHTSKRGQSLLARQVLPSEDEVLPIYAAKGDRIYPKLQFLMHSDRAGRPWQIRLIDLDHRETAFIGLRLDEDNQVSIEILDKECRSHGMTRMSRKLEVNPSVIDDHVLSDFLESVAFFRRHLKQAHSSSMIENLNQINIEFSELVSSGNVDEKSLLKQYEPKKEVIDGKEAVVNLIRDGKIVLDIPRNPVVNGQITTPERYGFTIRSSADAPLYVSIFFFSIGNFEIVSYYEAPHAILGENAVQPSIPAGGTLPVGYGPGGLPAWQYGMPADDEMDLGFLKFFISTEPIQLSHLAQDSAFDRVRGGRAVYPELLRPWSIITIPLIQNRAITDEPSNPT